MAALGRGRRSRALLALLFVVTRNRLGVSQKFSQDEPVGDIDWRATRSAVGPSIGRFSVD